MKKQSVVLLMVMLVMILAFTSCDVIGQYLPFLHEHTWVEATCTTPKTCSTCGETEGEALGHAEEVIEGKEATCTETGLTEGKKCSACGEVLVEQETIPTKAHTEETVAGKDASCTATGLTEGKKCSVCEKILVAQTEISKLPHTYDEGWDADCNVCGETRTCAHDGDKTVVPGYAATCTKSGLTDGETCAICGDVTVAQTVIEALGHQMSEATCTEAPECQREGCDYTEGEALGHSYDEGTVTTEPGCESEGVKLISCTREGCDHSYEEKIDAIGHSYTSTVVPATCIAKGYTEHVCGNCGDTYTDSETDLVDHTYVGSVTTEPGCETTGIKTYTCSVDGCGDSYTEELPANGHSEIPHEGKDATCTEAGWEAYVTCENCDYTTYKAISAKGHEGGRATCSALAVCDNCGEGYGNYDLVNGHDYGEADCDSPATCRLCNTTSGEAIGHTDVNPVDHKCDRCGTNVSEHIDNDRDHICDNGCSETIGECQDDKDEQDADHLCDYCGKPVDEPCYGGTASCTEKAVCAECGQEYGELLAHVYDQTKAVDAALKSAADCENTAVYYYSCTCGAVNNAEDAETFEVGSPLGHTEQILDGKAPTCTEAGISEGKKCSVCGDTLVAQEVLPALDHKYGEVAYTWSDDNSTCTATIICGNDASHIITETVTVTTVKLNLSGEKVTFTYNVEFANEVFAAQSKTVDGEMSVANKIATVYAPAIAGRVASHDYVKFGLHNAEETYEFTIYYYEVDVWDGTSVSEGLAGSGTAEDPFLIQSAADFAYFAAQLNNAAVGQTQNFEGQYFKMTKSIDLNGNILIAGNHIGWNKYQGFGGTFDGNNCSIRGINVEPTTGTSSALFGCITKAGTLKNLIVYGNAKGAGTVGGVVAYQLGTVDNVTSYVTVTATGGTIGGVVANQESSAGVLSNCVNYGNVTSTSYIVGGVVGSGGATITGCVNWGNVQGGAEKAGGIAGETKNAGTIEGCTNYGNVTMTVAGKGYVGGIAGNAVKPISNCVNYGTITGVNTTGGIAGLSTALVSNCVNYGTVNASSWNIGGISGRASGGIQNSINYADVTSTASGTVGGIVGTAQSNISDCENRGKVKGDGQCGGIVGVFSNNANITDCVNYGEVNGAWATGGIAGYSKVGTSTISGCENHGNLFCSTTSNGGIVGLVAENAVVTISDCINRGDVSGISWGGGGIAGDIIAGSISGCTNYGTISGQGQVGGIVGKSKVKVSDSANYGKITATVDIAAGICSQTTLEIVNCVNNGAIVGICTCTNIDGISTSNVTKTECVDNGTIELYHNLTNVDAKAPTCTEAGIVAHNHCSVCGKNFDAEGNELASLDIPAPGHTEEIVAGKAATCTENGLTEGKKCSVCGTILVEQEEIPAGHKDEDGDFKCDGCGEILCTEHVAGEAVKENEKAATCTDAGSYDNVVRCSVCGFEIRRDTVIVAAIGHDMQGTVEGTKKTYTCQRNCGETYVKYLVTVNYLNLDGSVAAEAEVKEYDDGTIYTINAKTVEGYVASHDYVKGHILSAGGTVNIYYSEVDVWDGTSVSESLQGSGTEEDPYLIQSGADLAYIAKVVNDAAASTANFKGQYFKMTKSIDLNGKALMIGGYTAGKVFHGFFDGNNCAIKGINATQSLFGMLKDGYIKNISTYGSVTTTEKKGVAGLVSYVSGATVENVTNYANITGVQQVAGVVGYLENNTTSIANNCVNYGTVKASSYQIGGIAGFAKGTLKNCTNFGDVSSSGSGYVGGVGGAAKDAKGSRSNCVNYGNVSGTDYVGGCFGQITKTTTDCYSYGTATATKGTNVGEVVGSGASYLK